MLREDAERRHTTLLPPPSDEACDYIALILARGSEVDVDHDVPAASDLETIPSPA
jgi:hypothetical protein